MDTNVKIFKNLNVFFYFNSELIIKFIFIFSVSRQTNLGLYLLFLKLRLLFFGTAVPNIPKLFNFIIIRSTYILITGHHSDTNIVLL